MHAYCLQPTNFKCICMLHLKAFQYLNSCDDTINCLYGQIHISNDLSSAHECIKNHLLSNSTFASQKFKNFKIWRGQKYFIQIQLNNCSTDGGMLSLGSLIKMQLLKIKPSESFCFYCSQSLMKHLPRKGFFQWLPSGKYQKYILIKCQ